MPAWIVLPASIVAFCLMHITTEQFVNETLARQQAGAWIEELKDQMCDILYG